MNTSQKLQSALTYLYGFGAMIGSACIHAFTLFEQSMPELTNWLQFLMALMGFVMVCKRYFHDRTRRKADKAASLNVSIT